MLVVAREAYARLYFLPDDVLLHSMAYEDDPLKLLKDFFKLCFTGVARVDVRESETILEGAGAKNQPLEIQEKHIDAVYGDHGERIELGEAVLFSHQEGGGVLSKAPQTKSESKPDELTVWAVKLEGEIKRTMKALLGECLDKIKALEFDEWIASFPLQCLWLVNEISWVKHVESQLSGHEGQTGNGIAKLPQQMSKKLQSLANKLLHMYTHPDKFKLKIKKIESLIHSGICHRDIAEYLNDEKVSEITDFSWQKFIRYYWHKREACCYVSCGSSVENGRSGFEYGFEYLGEDFALQAYRQGLSMNANAVLGVAHATFGTSCVTPVAEVFGAGFEKEVIQAVSLFCGQHLVFQDASKFRKGGSKDSWEDHFLACKESNSWMHLFGVDWFDVSLVSKLACALDEVRIKISSDLILSKACADVRYFVQTDHRYASKYENRPSPLGKVARRVCILDWSFKIAFEAAIELRLKQCGYE